MLGILLVYFLFILHFVFIECLIPGTDDLSVRILDKKTIERKREDTREMCRLFNSESHYKTPSYDKRRQEIKEHREYQKRRHSRVKRAVGPLTQVNPALNKEDEVRVENIVDKIYDDLLEKGEKVNYKRREEFENSGVKVNNTPTINNNTSGRRFPFVPMILEGPTTTKAPSNLSSNVESKPTRFHHAIVPYFIDSKTYDTHLADVIMKAFDYFEKATCIRLQRLRERPTDFQSLHNVVWLYITNPSGIRQCVHSNERAEIKGVQLIVFGYDCMSLGDITHEIMHVLGFAHEHARPDRDQYITILWDNIKPGYKKYFEIHKNPIVENLPYDYASVLHYPPRAFSRNGQMTILAEPGIKVGQREGLSEMDVEKIGIVYSNECVKRNREYLLKTCPSVVKSDVTPVKITQQEIEDYFENRLWPYGVVNFKFKDKMEFSAEELENINAVIRHIEKETCIEFRDLTSIPMEHSHEETSSDFNDDDAVDKYVQLGVGENETVRLPDLTTSEEAANAKLNNIDPDDTVRTGGKAKETNDTTSKPAARRKRAIPKSPTRRHVNSILYLARSPLPGCACPLPGKPEGDYILKLNTDCFNSVNDLLHAFVHVLGLDHQHNMHDRDSYLHIVWDQLTEDVKTEMKRKLPPAASVGFPYDYQSVMHYPWLQIKNGRTNIMYPIWNDGWAMGHWQGLSSTDVQKINLLYFKQCIQRKQQADEALKDESQTTSKKYSVPLMI